jgi:hypothetical protein
LGENRKAIAMSTETDEIEAAVSELTRAMARLVRAIDTAGDDGKAANHISEKIPEALEELAARISASKGFGA